MHCLTVSHKTATVDVRALFAFTEEEKKRFLHYLLEKEITKECVVLTTCNRSEIYFTGEKQAVGKLQQAVADFKKISLAELMKYFNVYHDEMAMKHLYKVACGMDSMVLGEDEILGQLKDAFFFARKEGATGYYLNTLFQDAITCAKRIKTDTNLSKIPVSVGTLVANEVFNFQKEDGTEKKVLIIGITGKMGTIVMKNINQKPGIQVYGTVRKHNASVQILEEGVEHVDYEKRYEMMEEADVIISVTSSPHYTITKEELEKVLRTNKKREFLDLSVPLDIDKEIQTIPGVTLYDIDYFEHLSKANNTMKLHEVHAAEAIADTFMEEVKKTLVFHEFLAEMPRVKAVFEHRSFESIIYELRDKAGSAEFQVIMDALREL